MAMPQRDDTIEVIKRLDACRCLRTLRVRRWRISPPKRSFCGASLEYAVMHGDEEEAERIREELRKLTDEKVDEWGWSLSRKERTETKRRAAEKKDPNADTSALESEIDQLVYKLYGLTDDEIAIVEGRNETKQEPQGEAARRPAASRRRRKQVTTPAPPESVNDKVRELMNMEG